ncbi:Periplasmic alpha-amylase [Cystobacter fuscus DSM 2262]|uniref:Periplasmic alpha-amylase n=1 Tax=Cystobacter fuscus (strain ATCC 25194 / DSM 2262 / NBRC 100088 / M29) TaxID=1242864 RepID=S9QJ54_CYSF2|nr:alpha-amylase family glycosyl hydrolase [Cystobacter fuscus]EPX61319.1 Periplasmic alpha-amylase [Cystobacter fuscus DSM 2262]
MVDWSSRRPLAKRANTRHPVVTSLLLPLAFTGCLHAPPSAEKVTSEVHTDAAVSVPVAAPAVAPRSWSDEVLYFVVVDRFADGDPANNLQVDAKAPGTFHGGDFKGLREQLDELSSLGVTALWITPVVKNIDGFVTGAGFPDWGYHGYWAEDFQQLEPRFGSEQELKALVDAAHQRGIRVLLDVVYNHPGYDSRYQKDPQTSGWLRSQEQGTCGQDDVTSCVSGLPDFKTEVPEVAKYLLDAQLAWGKRSGVDGFRLDTVKHVDHPFWREHRRRTREELGKDFFLLGEVWGGDRESLDPWFSGDELDAGFDFGFQGSALAWVQGRGRTVAFDAYLRSRHKVRKGYLLSHFLSSHDVPGALFQLAGDKARFRLAALLQFTTTGLPVIYYGEEVGRPGGDWPANRGDMPWGERRVGPGVGLPRDESLRQFYQQLVALRRAHPALSRGSHQGLATEGDVYTFVRHDPESGDAVVVAVNRGGKKASVSVPWPEAWGGAAARDLLDGSGLEAGPTLEITVEALSARILGRAP